MPKVVRKPETEAKYKEYLNSNKNGCPFCFKDGLPRKVLKKYKHWYITENLFPYDLHNSVSDMLVPFEHIEHFWDFNENQIQEYLEIRKELGDGRYDEMLENFPYGRTQVHFHQHLLKYL